MNTLKSLLLTTFLIATLASCSDDNSTSNPGKAYKISSVFGLKLGERGRGLTDGYIEDNKPFDFTPNPTHSSFNSYTFSVTPNTHTIYAIKMTGPKELATANCKEQRKEIIKETLATLGDTTNLKITEDGNKWKINENNQRSIIIDCELALTAATRQLVLIYSDAALSKLAYVEWSKHQDDIAKKL